MCLQDVAVCLAVFVDKRVLPLGFLLVLALNRILTAAFCLLLFFAA